MKWLAALIALLLATTAQADELRPGYLELAETAPREWTLGWKQPFALAPQGEPPPPVIPDNCAFEGPVRQGVAGLAVVGSAAMRCDGPLGGQRIGVANLYGQADMLVRVVPLGEGPQALRLTAREPSAQIAAPEAAPPVWRTYFALGVEHILEGWDHLLFVIALVLLLRDWRRAVIAATAFTVAHSLTLAGATLGLLSMPQRPVEVLIALSIVFLAVEIVKRDPAAPSLATRLPWVVAFLFGLLHGFGFAGALASIGLPEGAIAPALLAFNLGVEAGQLLVVAATLALLALAGRLARQAFEPGMNIAAYAVGITGSYWLIDRLTF
jgi:hydrogenase/urease accessory protein HupE